MKCAILLAAVALAFGHCEAIAGPEISLRDDLAVPFLEEYGWSILLVSILGGYVGYRIGRRKKHPLAGAILGAMLGAIGWIFIALALLVA